MSKIGPAELDERRASEQLFVLDIRPREDYRAAHIDGSYNAPVYHEVRQGDTGALDAHLGDVPDEAPVVVVCKAGVVAREATAYLDERGYDARTLSGGFTGWTHYEANSLPYRVLSFVGRLLP